MMSPSVFEDGVVWGNGEDEPGGEMVVGGVGQLGWQVLEKPL